VDNIKLFIKIVNNKNDLFYKCVEYFYIQDFKKTEHYWFNYKFNDLNSPYDKDWKKIYREILIKPEKATRIITINKEQLNLFLKFTPDEILKDDFYNFLEKFNLEQWLI
jgi:hypothetical protein